MRGNKTLFVKSTSEKSYPEKQLVEKKAKDRGGKGGEKPLPEGARSGTTGTGNGSSRLEEGSRSRAAMSLLGKRRKTEPYIIIRGVTSPRSKRTGESNRR